VLLVERFEKVPAWHPRARAAREGLAGLETVSLDSRFVALALSMTLSISARGAHRHHHR